MADTTTPELTPEEHDFLESVFEMARTGAVEQLAPLLDAGIPVDLTNSRGDTLLILAAYHQHPQAVAALIERGADVNRVNDMEQTAMSCAVFRNNSEIVTTLLAAGADPDLGGHTAQAIARQFGLAEMEELLRSHALPGNDSNGGAE
ncbi:ankyrin repeat domain-containing protein [Salinibacterium hongtaonis]|uniref:ankyrin repeat domain-containing protein n=1 Tax=Homoserinimonas hongtaonis TaxID=2079791 RepID=UPI000D35E417|nr:ankyrin repeat domain-containing protein [Salinibacterium hongtaonis]AWB89559.1 hypothetical protein C2138_08405 [Salinibacterium hongtaonis]